MHAVCLGKDVAPLVLCLLGVPRVYCAVSRLPNSAHNVPSAWNTLSPLLLLANAYSLIRAELKDTASWKTFPGAPPPLALNLRPHAWFQHSSCQPNSESARGGGGRGGRRGTGDCFYGARHLLCADTVGQNHLIENVHIPVSCRCSSRQAYIQKYMP